MSALLERFRLTIAIASAILIVTTLATLGWAIALTAQLVGTSSTAAGAKARSSSTSWRSSISY